MLRNRSGSPTFPERREPSKAKLGSPVLSPPLFHARGASPSSALDSIPKLIQPASIADTARSKAKRVGDISPHLSDFIEELVICQVNLKVGDMRARLDRLEALLFHADAKSFEAIDKFLSSAKRRHTGEQHASKKFLARSAESSSPEPSPMDSNMFMHADKTMVTVPSVAEDIITASLGITAKKPLVSTWRNAKVLSRKIAGDVIETASLQPAQGEPTRVERVAGMSPERLAEISPKVFPVDLDTLVQEEPPKVVTERLFAPTRPARVLGTRFHSETEVGEVVGPHIAQEEATHTEPVSTLKQATHLKSASTIVRWSVPENIYGLWASSCGRVVRVDHLGCRFDSGPRFFESECYKLCYCKSYSPSVRDQIIWTQRETGDSTTWHRLSHSTWGEWAPMSDDARVGDIVRVDRRFEYFMEVDSTEPETFLEGLRGCIVAIDDAGDWLINFPSLTDGQSQRWVMKANATQLSVFTSVAT